MEKTNFVKNGVLRLPPGFRFHPTDEELVVHYLKCKVFSCSLPSFIIPQFDVCKTDPWDLPGETKQERYFFSKKEAKYPNGKRSNRATISGYWKPTGKDKVVLAKHQQVVVGMKKTLVFYKGKPPHGSRTQWIMHEYRLLKPQPLNSYLLQKTGEATGDWVLCRIFLKKKNNAAKKDDDDEEEGIICEVEDKRAIDTKLEKPVFYDFMSRDRGLAAPCSSSSGSSAVTNEIDCKKPAIYESSEELDEGSSCNSFSYPETKP